MPLDFEQTPIRTGDTERNITPDAIGGEVAFDLHKGTLEAEGDWELSRDRDAARQNLEDIFQTSQTKTPEYAVERMSERRGLLLAYVIRTRSNAVATGAINPEMQDRI
jgi:hypothetical protein